MDKPHYIKCGPVPVLRDWRTLPIEKLTRGERNCRFIEHYCVIPEGEHVGKPVRLIDEQVMFYLAIYDNPNGTDVAIKSMARKNSKTADIAFLVLIHTVGPEAIQNSRINSGANSKEQAAEVYNYASKCVMLSEKLSEICKLIENKNKIIGLPMNVTYQAISAEAKTGHGKSPVVLILDEVGQIEGPQDDFIDSVTTGQGAYDTSLLIYISTQAADDAALFSQLIDDAIENQPPNTVLHLFEAPEDCDLMDETAWKMANPAMGIFRSKKDIKKQAEKAMRMPSFENTFRNLILNQRIAKIAPFVSKSVWQENGKQPSSLKGKKVYAGLDLSSVSDLTALVLVSEDGDISCTFWLPDEGLRHKAKQDKVPYDVWKKKGILKTTPGRSIEYEYIAGELKTIFEECDIQQLNFDRYNMKFLKPWLIKKGFKDDQVEKFKEFGQGFYSMTPALRDLESRLLQKKLKHGMNPILTMCAGNVRVESDAAGGRKFTKKKSKGRIDGMVALAMAVSAMNPVDSEKEKTFDMFFV